MTNAADLVDRVLELRRDFDAGFARAPSDADIETCDLLAIRVAGEPYVLRVAEIAELAQGRKIVGLPSRRADVLGVAAIRGNLVSVHSLAKLLGHATEDSHVPWLALCLGLGGIALAFGQLERLVRMRTDEVPRGERGTRHLAGAVRVEGLTRPLVDVGSIVATLSTVPDLGRSLT